ncbi:hypothetical protein MUG91_G78n58 [Manis pentadactyla]|nr:hypothetical protein MUG91_G78n58 [Manis pentadactyla]
MALAKPCSSVNPVATSVTENNISAHRVHTRFKCSETDEQYERRCPLKDKVAIHKPPASETRGKKPPGTLKATSCSSDYRIHFSGFGCGLRESHPVTAHNKAMQTERHLGKCT